jgi:hypothetical protein
MLIYDWLRTRSWRTQLVETWSIVVHVCRRYDWSVIAAGNSHLSIVCHAPSTVPRLRVAASVASIQVSSQRRMRILEVSRVMQCHLASRSSVLTEAHLSWRLNVEGSWRVLVNVIGAQCAVYE